MVKCIECGRDVCFKKSKFYKHPLNKMCLVCREAKLRKKKLIN